MAEEYKRKWHEHHDPRADDKVYLGTRLLDLIEKSAIDTYQDERTLEGWEWANPISVGTAGAIRTVEGIGTVLANTPLVAQGLQAYGKVADVAAGNVGSLVATTGLDPRFGGWAVRLGEAWYGGQAISAASKSKYARAAGKFAKIQADEVGMKASMAMKKKHGKVWKNPKAGVEPDPWFESGDLKDISGPKKTYERYAKRTYYPSTPLEDFWSPPISERIISSIDDTPAVDIGKVMGDRKSLGPPYHMGGFSPDPSDIRIPAGSPDSVTGSAMQRYEAARRKLRAQGIIRRDGSARQIAKQTPSTRGRIGNAQIVNDLSDFKNWNVEGNKRIEEWANKLTAREQELAGVWHKHHKRPLSQNAWMVQGLPPEELIKAQKYSYKRMAAGGDVLNNQRITPQRPHNLTHESLNTQLGDMRLKGGASIRGILDPGMSVRDYLSIPTFEGRKAYISRFYDITERADKQVGRIMDAMDVTRKGGPLLSSDDVAEVFSHIDDPRAISIIDDLLDDITSEMNKTDVLALTKINEQSNELWRELDGLYEKAGSKVTGLDRTPKPLRRRIEVIEEQITNLDNQKAELIPDKIKENLQLKLQLVRRSGSQGTTPRHSSPWDYGQD